MALNNSVPYVGKVAVNYRNTRGRFAVTVSFNLFIALPSTGSVANDPHKEKYDILVMPSSLRASCHPKDF